MRYGSVCSGIEAASVAWEPQGWRPAWFSEIEAFPSQVLAHRFPYVSNLGDMTGIAQMVRLGIVEAPDVLVGGTPCQPFSVAGLRQGLADKRGQLTLSYVELVNAIDDSRADDGDEPCIAVWENVPGCLSSKDNAFGCFLAALAGEDVPLEPPGKRWPDAGLVVGPQRAIAWRVLDAQFFGLAQRRKRVFLVASARQGFDPADILLEFEGVRRDSPPSREAGEGITHPTAQCLTSSGRGVERTGEPRGQDPVVAVVGGDDRVAPTLDASYARLQGCSGQDLRHGHGHLVLEAQAYGGNNQSGPIDVATARNAHSGPHGRLDFESETFVVEPVAFDPKSALAPNGGGGISDQAYPLKATGHKDQQVVCVTGDVTHTLKAEGFDASEDGTGRGQPIVVHGTQDPCVSDIAFQGRGSNIDLGQDVTGTLSGNCDRASGGAPCIAFSSKDYGADASVGDMPTLRAGGHTDSHANAGIPPAVLCFDTTQLTHRENRSNPKPGDPAHPPRAGAHAPAIAYSIMPMNSGKDFKARVTDIAQPIMAAGPTTGNQGGDYNVVPATVTMQARRLMPVECERLQGFPDGWTDVPVGPKQKPAADGPRYKSLGNSMATHCMAWIGRRIQRYLEQKPLLDMIG